MEKPKLIWGYIPGIEVKSVRINNYDINFTFDFDDLADNTVTIYIKKDEEDPTIQEQGKE